MFEVLTHYMPKIQASDVLERTGLKKEKFFVVSAHREENINNEKNFNGLITTLNLIAEKYNFPIIMTTHPRTRLMIESKNLNVHSLVRFFKPLGFIDYNALQINSFVILSDSGTISEESSILNLRALNIRDAHERPEAMEEASVIMVGLDPNRIIRGITEIVSQPTGNQRHFRRVSDYSMLNVSDKVIRIILSYTSYINRVVWSKDE